MECNHDCLNCKYSECRNNEITENEYQSSYEFDREVRNEYAAKRKRKRKSYSRTEYQHRYYLTNKDKVAEKNRMFAEQNPTYAKRYYENHMEERKAYFKARYQERKRSANNG